MTNTYLKIAALALAIVPNVAMAQSAISDPAVPGSGYRIPPVSRTSTQPPVASQVDASVPGSGYQIPAAPRTSHQPLVAYAPDPGVPGDGYRIGN
jgi:hypothetical protein